MDMRATIAPKSDQLNADDLLAGPRDIVITRVVGCPSPEQPVAVHFEGDDGKPYKPCKSMRRVMVMAWGPDASQYVGRSMRLYRDPKVLWGGMEVGGIRVSHMSHLEREMTVALTATQKARKPYTVKVMEATKPSAPSTKAIETAKDRAATLRAKIAEAADGAALTALLSDASVKRLRDWLAENLADLSAEIEAEIEAACVATANT